ncbi:hypothetical protein [uncultured Salinicola sp.]|uniref:hypothetical protein n=1 Tax=uncultured Salinicola sp. TaxID=1193542 RepID=UPI0026043156|nr:hypothetical protein [uncultured Salinicola sp.]|tara:strand:- start:1793 stop:2257 length:465 start_codon:yes stop_codon:yes gene_type:complete
MKENTILPSFVTTALLSMARSHMAANAPNQVLEEYGEAYMHRWFLEKDRTRGSVYIHHILRSDYDPELHDHPGDNMSILLHGAISEQLESGSRILVPGSVVLRKAEERHRLLIEEPVITLWIMGERTREWGFWMEDGSFVPSQRFFDMRSRPVA